MQTIRNSMTPLERDSLLNGAIKEMVYKDPAFLYEIISVIRKEKNKKVKRQFSKFVSECNQNIAKHYVFVEV